MHKPYVQRAVVVSTSRDVFRNLALEHWFYKHRRFDAQHHLLMLWVNAPCVVIGRHQNPWTECNVPWLRATATPLARRNSGGGAVYHDGGNLNLTFFTPNEHYDRRANLQFVADAVYEDHGLRMEINQREDLAVRDCKVSGTAAKLARHCAYHHCTLLIAADKQRLRSALLPTDWRVATNATRSTRSKVLNLVEECPTLGVDALIATFARRYLNLSDGAQLVTPSEQFFPGLDAIHDEYASWQWTFGMTPRFDASKTFHKCELKVHVEGGVIRDVDVDGRRDADLVGRLRALVGERYDVERVEHAFKDASDVDRAVA